MAKPSHIVAIGGSAGGLEAFLCFLDALSPATGMAFIYVSHLSPTEPSELVSICQLHTSMDVVWAETGMPFLRNTIFVIPPDVDPFASENLFHLTSPRTLKRHRHHQVDCMLGSLAQFHGTSAIAIIFSGGDGDGTEGCAEIKKGGGITFAQDSSAAVPSMPRTAVTSGTIDYVLSPVQMAGKLELIALSGRDTSAVG